MMSLWDALRMNMMISYQELVRTFLRRLWPSVLVVCAYSTCYFALTRAMSTIPVGVAYSLWCGFGIVGVTIFSMILYKQKPDLPAIFSMLLIISGGIIMNVFSNM